MSDVYPSDSGSTREYFAAADREHIAQKLHAKVSRYDMNHLTSAVAERFRRAYLYYYGLDYAGIPSASMVVRGGEQGELAEVRVNHSRALVQTQLNLVVAPQVVWTPVATNSDYKSAGQAILANSLLEFYWKDQHLAQTCRRATEEAIVFTEGFVFAEWDPMLGEDYAAGPDAMGIGVGSAGQGPPAVPGAIEGVGREDSTSGTTPGEESPSTHNSGSATQSTLQSSDTGSVASPSMSTNGPIHLVHKTGDVRFTNVSTWDVVRDSRKKSWEESDWVILKLRRNKFDLAHRYAGDDPN